MTSKALVKQPKSQPRIAAEPRKGRLEPRTPLVRPSQGDAGASSEESAATLAQQRKSAKARANYLIVAERRLCLAKDFRERLIAALPPDSGPAREALVNICVSAFVEVTEVSQQFYSARAHPRAVKSLGVARGQLQRALRALGLCERDDDEPPPPTVAEIIARFDKKPEGNQ